MNQLIGAHAVRNRPMCGGVGWAGAGVAWRLGVCVVFGAFWAVWRQVKMAMLHEGLGGFVFIYLYRFVDRYLLN
jgi:hypothetical protein